MLHTKFDVDAIVDCLNNRQGSQKVLHVNVITLSISPALIWVLPARALRTPEDISANSLITGTSKYTSLANGT